VLVVAAVDVYVEVAADDDRTVVDSELFEHRRQIDICCYNDLLILTQFGDNIQTSRQLRNAVFAKFFDKS